MPGSSWAPKLVAVDADGTIIGPDAGDVVPEELVAKLRQIDELGVPVVLVTGRPWLSAQVVLDQLKIPHVYCVCNNGAMVVTYPPLEILVKETIDPAPVVEVVRAHPTVLMAVEFFGVGWKVSQIFPAGALFPLYGHLQVTSYDDLAAQPVTRIIMWDPVSSKDQFNAFVARLDLSDLSHVREGPTWLDLGSSKSGKHNGLAIVSKKLGVNQTDVLAIGDGANDIEFLRWAGRGVALGNAPDQLKAVADATTCTLAEGGTLSELKKWFP